MGCADPLASKFILLLAQNPELKCHIPGARSHCVAPRYRRAPDLAQVIDHDWQHYNDDSDFVNDLFIKAARC
jgi:hypothetical protein